MLTLDQALAELPDTADGIAEFLRERGIRGICGDSYSCVVAKYLVSKGFTAAAVGDIRIEACADDSGFEEARTPEPVTEFLKRFDSQAWPELIGGEAA